MRVLVLLTRAFRTNARMHREVEALRDAGHEVTVLEWARHEPDAAPFEEVHGVPVHRVHSTGLMGVVPGALLRTPLWWRRAAKRALQLHEEDPFDAVCAVDLDTLPIGARVKDRTGLPLVFNALEIFATMIEDDHPRLVARAAQALEDRLLADVDRVTTVNDHLAGFYRDRTDATVAVVRNCATPVETYEAPEAETFTVTYVGLFHRSRFFPEAVHALGGMEDVRLVLAGKREEAYDEVEQAAAGHDNVEFLGPLPSKEVLPRTVEGHAVLRLADPAAARSQVETPVKVFEAMAAGRPSIVTEGTLAGDLVADRDVGVAVPYTAEALRDAVADLRDDPDRCEAMGRRGLELAREEFNWEAQAETLRGVYGSLAER